MIVGATFSHRHLTSLNLKILTALKDYRQLGLKWIRLGCYWDEIEKVKGVYNFNLIKELVVVSGKLDLNVVLTIGMKAPRHPEFYLPGWLEKNLKPQRNYHFNDQEPRLTKPLFEFISRAVEILGKYPTLKVWQIENEPLDPGGPHHWQITSSLLQNEVQLVKKLDSSRPILINLWGNGLVNRNLYPEAVRLADIIGLDLYFKVPIFPLGPASLYHGPWDSDRTLKRVIAEIQNSGKKVWLTELQAEPWELNELVTRKVNPQSCSPDQLVKNTNRILDFGVDGIFFWGFEYWLWRKTGDDGRYWNKAKEAIALLRWSPTAKAVVP